MYNIIDAVGASEKVGVMDAWDSITPTFSETSTSSIIDTLTLCDRVLERCNPKSRVSNPSVCYMVLFICLQCGLTSRAAWKQDAETGAVSRLHYAKKPSPLAISLK